MLMRTVRPHKGSGVEVSSAFRVGRQNRDFSLTWTGLPRSHGFSRPPFNVWALFGTVTAHGQQNKWAFFQFDYRTAVNWWQQRTWHSESIVPSLRRCSAERHSAPECSRKHCSRLATNFRLPPVPSSYPRADGWITQWLAISGQLQVKSSRVPLPLCAVVRNVGKRLCTSAFPGSRCGKVLAPLWTLGLWTSHGARWRILSQSETAEGLVFSGGRRGYFQPCAQSPGSTMCAGGGRAPSFKPVQPRRATNPCRSSLSATSLKFSNTLSCLSGALDTVCDAVGHLRELLMDHHQTVRWLRWAGRGCPSWQGEPSMDRPPLSFRLDIPVLHTVFQDIRCLTCVSRPHKQEQTLKFGHIVQLPHTRTLKNVIVRSDAVDRQDCALWSASVIARIA